MTLAALLAAAPAMAAARSDDLAAYARARAAAANGEVEAASQGYAEALAASPGNEIIAIRAYREAMAAGDYDLARRSGEVLVASRVAPADWFIFAFADAVRAGDDDKAAAMADLIAKGPLDFLAPVMRAWIAFDRHQDPIAVLDAARPSAVGQRYVAEHRALLLIASGKTEAGVAAIQSLMGGPGELGLRADAADLLAGTGHRTQAESLLAGDQPVRVALRDHLGRGEKPSLRFGASRLLVRLATDLAGEETEPLSILLARSALLIDSGSDRARLVLAAALARQGAVRRALATLDAIRGDSPYADSAARATIATLSRAGEDGAALERAQALAGAYGATADDFQTLGDLLMRTDRFQEAADAYGRAMAAAGASAGWVLNLQRGGALERAGHWAEALPYLRRAVELAPDQAVALNYLGYAQVERGENMAEATRLLEKAKRLDPEDASITDSLAWSYYRRGQFAKALPLLEQAASQKPGDVVVNEHLGDVYWQMGRRIEARYAWRAAAVYAEGKDAARLAAKLAGEQGPELAIR